MYKDAQVEAQKDLDNLRKTSLKMLKRQSTLKRNTTPEQKKETKSSEIRKNLKAIKRQSTLKRTGTPERLEKIRNLRKQNKILSDHLAIKLSSEEIVKDARADDFNI